ncbi:MAG: GNAT family N-acetyltransferase [Chitinophagales bacterium]|nr:GNAT family N-acetyltransferase [Chitinophagales bacterium]
MPFTIKIADVSDPVIDLSLRQLIKEATNATNLLPEKFLTANLDSGSSRKSFFLVAVENGQVIGCNAFLAYDFVINGIGHTGYQSCWTATHPQHQGKKVFSNLINEAKDMLKREGAGFIYGIANDSSNPIFTKRLGFTETETLVLRIPNLPGYKNSYLSGKAFPPVKNCVVNEEQVKAHKLLQYPNQIKEIRYNESWLWGKLLHKRKFGIRLPVFHVGGISLSSAGDLKGLLTEVFRQYNILFIQFVSCGSNTFNGSLKGWKKANMNGFIFYSLNIPEPEHLDLMVGVLDVF